MIDTACHWCEKTHGQHLSCDPARRVLDALRERGMAGNMPTIEFPQPVPAEQLGLGAPDDRLVLQLVIEAAVVEAAGQPQPAVIFTGRDAYGQQLPKWLYVGNAVDMAAVVRLVKDMTDLAQRRATEART